MPEINDRAWRERVEKIKKIREERDLHKSKDPIYGRIHATNLNCSMSTEICAVVPDTHLRSSRENIYAHRQSQGVMKKDEDGTQVKRLEESFLREMSTPKFIRVKNDNIKQKRIHKLGYVPEASRLESVTGMSQSMSAMDDSGMSMEVDSTLENTLKETNRHRGNRDKRHMSIHESLTRPLTDFFTNEEEERQAANNNSNVSRSSGLGHFAQPTKSSAYRYAESGHHSVMHSSGAEWWGDQGSQLSASGLVGPKQASQHHHHSKHDRQKAADRRRSAHAHTKRVVHLVTDYMLKPFNGQFIDRDSHYKIPCVHSSRRRSLSVNRGLITTGFGTGRGDDSSNIRLVAGMHRRSQSAEPVSRRHSARAMTGGDFDSISASPVSSTGSGSGSQLVSPVEQQQLRGRGRARGRMSTIEAAIPGMYRPGTAPGVGSPELHRHRQMARRALGPWVPAGNKGRVQADTGLTSNDGNLNASSLSVHINVNQAGQERHDRMKYWVSTKAMREKIRSALQQTGGSRSQHNRNNSCMTGGGERKEGEGEMELLDSHSIEPPSLTRRVSAATEATNILNRTSHNLNLLRPGGNEISGECASGAHGPSMVSEHSGSSSHQRQKPRPRQRRTSAWLQDARAKLSTGKEKGRKANKGKAMAAVTKQPSFTTAAAGPPLLPSEVQQHQHQHQESAPVVQIQEPAHGEPAAAATATTAVDTIPSPETQAQAEYHALVASALADGGHLSDSESSNSSSSSSD